MENGVAYAGGMADMNADWWWQCQRCFREESGAEDEVSSVDAYDLDGEMVCVNCMTRDEREAVRRALGEAEP